MKMLFASILFCLLLLPSVGGGQGVVLNENINYNEERSAGPYVKEYGAYVINKGFVIKLASYDTIRTYKDRFKVSDWYGIKNVDYFIKEKVRKFQVFDSSGKLCYSAEFSKSGQILKEGVLGEYYFTLSSFNRSEKKFEQSIQYYDGKYLVRYDSVFHHIFEHSKKMQEIKGRAEITISYTSGRLVNQRNEFYNNNYYRKILEYSFPVNKLDKPRQQHKAGIPFVYLQTRLKTNYIDSFFYCQKIVSLKLNYIKHNKEQKQQSAFKTSFMKNYIDTLRQRYQLDNPGNIDGDNFQEFGDLIHLGELHYPKEYRNYFEPIDNRTTTLQYNNRKLVDTVFWNYSLKQTGRSIKKALFTFRYEYFDE